MHDHVCFLLVWMKHVYMLGRNVYKALWIIVDGSLSRFLFYRMILVVWMKDYLVDARTWMAQASLILSDIRR